MQNAMYTQHAAKNAGHWSLALYCVQGERSAVGTKLCAGGSGSDWSRLGRAEFFFRKTPPKHAAEPPGCPCRLLAPQNVWAKVRVSDSSEAGLFWADVQSSNWSRTSCTKCLADRSCIYNRASRQWYARHMLQSYEYGKK